jgi:hypothetical protein
MPSFSLGCKLLKPHKILNIRLHIRTRLVPKQKNLEYAEKLDSGDDELILGTHGRVRQSFNPIDVKEILREWLQARTGRMIISGKHYLLQQKIRY